MKVKSKPFVQIDRQYIITSKELKKQMEIKGEITGIGLWRGRSPDEIEKGKSPDLDEWEIRTTEKIKIKDKEQK
jgi:hypothetical protein